jgi:hypothetical protein
MSVDTQVALGLDDLPMDVVELADQGLVVESLTTGHGMTPVAASACSIGWIGMPTVRACMATCPECWPRSRKAHRPGCDRHWPTPDFAGHSPRPLPPCWTTWTSGWSTSGASSSRRSCFGWSNTLPGRRPKPVPTARSCPLVLASGASTGRRSPFAILSSNRWGFWSWMAPPGGHPCSVDLPSAVGGGDQGADQPQRDRDRGKAAFPGCSARRVDHHSRRGPRGAGVPAAAASRGRQHPGAVAGRTPIGSRRPQRGGPLRRPVTGRGLAPGQHPG